MDSRFRKSQKYETSLVLYVQGVENLTNFTRLEMVKEHKFGAPLPQLGTWDLFKDFCNFLPNAQFSTIYIKEKCLYFSNYQLPN